MAENTQEAGQPIGKTIDEAANKYLLPSIITSLIEFGYSIKQKVKQRKGKKIANDNATEVGDSAAAGFSVGAKLSAAVSKAMPANPQLYWSEIGTPVVATLTAILFTVFPFFKKRKNFENSKIGLEIGVSVTAGIAAGIVSHITGLNFLETGLISTGAAVVGAVGGAVASAKLLPKVTKEDKKTSQKTMNGFSLGALFGGALGGLLGIFIPGFGAGLGTSIGAGLGSLIGGGAVIASPIMQRIYKKYSAAHKFFASSDARLTAKVGATLGTGIGMLLGGPIGAAIGGALGVVLGYVGYKIYEHIKIIDNSKINDSIKATNDELAGSIHKTKTFITEAKSFIVKGSVIGATIGMLIGGPTGAIVGAAIGTATGIGFTIFQRVTKGTRLGKAVDSFLATISMAADRVTTATKNKLASLFAPTQQEVELEEWNNTMSLDEMAANIVQDHTAKLTKIPHYDSEVAANQNNFKSPLHINSDKLNKSHFLPANTKASMIAIENRKLAR